MGKKHALFATLLMSQTSSAVALHFDFIRDLEMPRGAPAFARFRITDPAHPTQSPVEERLPLEILRIDFEQRLRPGVYQNLQPMVPVQDGDLGEVLQRIYARVRYGQEEYIWNYVNPAQRYPIRATWHPQANPGVAQATASLRLHIHDEYGRDRDIIPTQPLQPKNINHQLTNQGNVEDRGIHFDGRRVFSIHAQAQNDAARPGQSFVIEKFLPEIPRHEGRQVIFAQPFVASQDRMPDGGYVGRYQFHGTLGSTFWYPHTATRSLVYSDGQGGLFLPHITQESWRLNHNTLVRFLIASYKPQDALFFTPGTRMDGGHHAFEEGLYQLLSMEETSRERLERWARVEQDLRPGTSPDTIISVRTPAGVPAIPGRGNETLEWFRLRQGTGLVPVIQEGMSQIVNYLKGFKGLENSPFVVVMGPTGAGKSTLVHLIADEAGKQLKVVPHPEGRRDNVFAPDQELPGIAIGHRVGVVGTTKPAPWTDGGNQTYWDTNGLGDPRAIGEDRRDPNLAASQDILNAFTINTLVSGRPNVKFLLAVPELFMLRENQGGRQFLEIVDQFTHSFPDGNAWYPGVCLVVTHSIEYEDHKALLRQMLGIPQGQNTFLDRPRVRNFLDYLSANGHDGERVISFRKPGFFNLKLNDRYPGNRIQQAPSGTRSDIVRGITGTQSLQNPIFRLAVSSDVEKITRELADQVNQNFAHFMNTQVLQKLRDYFFDEVTRPQPVATLRDTLKNRLDGINGILANFGKLTKIQADAPDAEQRSVGVVTRVLNQLFGLQANAANNQWLNSTIASDIVRQLTFLRTLNNTVRYDTAAWTADFLGFAQRLRPLSEKPRDPKGNFDDQTHTLSFPGGFIYGTSDINGALALQPKADIRHIILPCSHAVIIDEDINDNRLAGGSVNIFSPLWVVHGDRTMTLNGGDGQPHANAAADGTGGAVGNTGGDGGIITGKAAEIIRPTALTVRLKGGAGSKGQTGGQGAAGAGGAHEEYPPTLEVQQANTGGPVEWSHRFIGVGGNCRFGQIKVRHGALVDAVEFIARVGRSGTVSLGRRGGLGGSETIIDLSPDEYLTGVRGEGAHDDLKKLYFITNKRTLGPYGTSGGPAFDTNKNQEICGMALFFNNELTILKNIHLDHPGALRRIRERTNGGGGGQGARGGNGGNGGRAGIFSVDGIEFATLNANSTREPGAGGAKGTGGAGGRGGLHGKFHNEDEDSWAADGNQGNEGAATGASPQDPQLTEAALGLLKNQYLMRYAQDYWNAASNPQTAQLVRVFPGIPHPH